MAKLQVGNRVVMESGSTGRVAEVTDTDARVEFDDDRQSGWFGREEHLVDFGVLKLL